MSENNTNVAQTSDSSGDYQGGGSDSFENSSSSPQAVESKPAAPSKLKVDWEDGFSEELTHEELVSHYKLNKKEAAALKNQMNPIMQFMSALQSGELDHLAALGIPEDKILAFAEKRLEQHVKYMNMPEEQREQMKEMDRLRAENSEAKELKAKEKARRQEAIDQQASMSLQKDIVDAVNELGLQGKPSPRLIRRVAEQMLAQESSKRSTDPKLAAKHEFAGLQKDLHEYQLFALKANPSQFVESLPAEVRQAIREYELKGARPFAKPARDEEEEAPKSKGKVIDLDYLENLYGPKKKRVK